MAEGPPTERIPAPALEFDPLPEALYPEACVGAVDEGLPAVLPTEPVVVDPWAVPLAVVVPCGALVVGPVPLLPAPWYVLVVGPDPLAVGP